MSEYKIFIKNPTTMKLVKLFGSERDCDTLPNRLADARDIISRMNQDGNDRFLWKEEVWKFEIKDYVSRLKKFGLEHTVRDISLTTTPEQARLAAWLSTAKTEDPEFEPSEWHLSTE